MVSRRPKLIYRSQQECVDAWLSCLKPRHANEPVPTEGWARGWYYARALHFVGVHLYSTSENGSQEVEIARLVRTPKQQWVVCVQKETHEWQRRSLRCGIVRWRATQAGLVWVHVHGFDEAATTQAWYAERVQAQLGRWRRARVHKQWRFMWLDTTCQERAKTERVLGWKRTREESEVRVARVTQRLLAGG